MLRLSILAAATALALAGAARAEEPKLRDLCAERPGATTPPCIVDAGHLMVEVDALDVSRNRASGVTQESLLAASPHLRLGLTDTLEAGLTITPFAQQRLRDGGARSTTTGFGDAQANLKISLRNPDGGGLSVALLPYVSLPTAQKGLGAGGFQGGVILPVAAALGAGVTLGVSPEVDVLRNAGRGGTHANYLGAISLSRAVAPGVNGAVELISSVNRDPSGHVRQTSAGANLAWIPQTRPNLQLDAGADFGLNRAAPDARLYVGVSRRF